MNKIRFWETWDWTSIRSIFILIFALVSVFIFLEKYPDFVRNGRAGSLINTTVANVESITPIEHFNQSAYSGNYVSQDYFQVNFNYTIHGQNYSSTDKFPNSTENAKFIGKLIRGELRTISIRYNPQQPEKSQIIVERI